ncbi:flagellar hook-length control protein FliK [Shewanella sp. HL-SH5]|uniref:flagellar hook-length control protein FliK n=1 Tax=Shewanella sp. HL-SH5 TaxID=3436241 RepID=UPI003EBCF4C8
MQQMSNILLTGTSKSTGSQAKDAIQASESKSFIDEFNQASQMSSFQSAKLVNTSKQSEQSAITTIDVDLSEPLEGTDIELIFAQLDMAQSFDKSKGDGQILPIFEVKGESNVTDDGSLDAITQALSNIDGIESDFDILDNQVASKDTDSDITNIDLLENSLFSNMIQLPLEGESNDEFLASLSDSEKELLSDFSTLSAEQLIALSHDDLVNLVADFNLQAPVLDESILDLAAKNLEVKWDPIAANSLNDVSPAITESSPIAPLQAPMSAMASANMAKNIIQDSDATKLANDSLGQKNNALFSSVGTQDSDNILGDKAPSPANVIEPMAVAQVDSKTPASVESLKTASVAALTNIDSELAKSARIDVFGAPDEAIDVKAMQNQSSFTPIHKSEVPQFQLSLKQQGESQVQMQEMIQRFSPVMKQQLITMVSNGIQQAEIRLDPPELGHLTVKIQINGDQTQVQFHVTQSQTRELIEQAIPRLRDMLAQEGLQLTDSQVSQGGGGRDGQPQDSSERYAEQQNMDENSAVEHSMFQNHPESLQSGIDYYA